MLGLRMSHGNSPVFAPMARGNHVRPRRILLGIAIPAMCAVVALSIGLWWAGIAWRRPSKDRVSERTEPGEADASLESRIHAFCGDCHAVPRPESFPRDAWHVEVEKAYRKYEESGRVDLEAPPMGKVIEFFRSRAPEALSYPEPTEAATPFRAKFQPEKLDRDPDQQSAAAIAGLCWTPLGSGKNGTSDSRSAKESDAGAANGEPSAANRSRKQGFDAPPVLLASDMLSGRVTAVDLGSSQRTSRLLAQLNHPCHIEPCDLDGDGAIDLLIADLGSYDVRDHDLGRVVWLRQDGGTGRFREIVLVSGLGRVADARPIAIDASGTLGLVVAEFGYFRTGSVRLLTNIASPGQPPRFESRVLDPRTGAIHVPVCDVNQDGRPDFFALVSNESESLEVFLNQGNGKFHRRTVWQAPDLAFGSSGIELVDLDGDGDLDVLYTNGDSFDNMYVTPWHGVQWLENLGAGQFQYHRLADMSGACVARAGDFDGDGDLDILVVAFLPPRLKPDWLAERPLPSIVLLEQTSPGHFMPHILERGFPCHAALAVGDFNRDGRLDFVVGNHAGGHRANALGLTWATVWWNRGI